MWRCRTVDGLIRILPFKTWQDVLIRRHAMTCADCLGKLAALEEVQSLLVQEQDLVEVQDFWPMVKQRLRGGPPDLSGMYRPFWTWISAAAGLAIVILAGFWLFNGTGGGTGPEAGRKLHINYVKIEDKPARAYVFHPQDVDMTLVWVEKDGEGE
jgi:hypothetical protein